MAKNINWLLLLKEIFHFITFTPLKSLAQTFQLEIHLIYIQINYAMQLKSLWDQAPKHVSSITTNMYYVLQNTTFNLQNRQ